MSATKSVTASTPWFMLLSRSLLFILAQVLIALIISTTGTPNAWDESTRYWTLIAAAANIASLYLLVRVYKAEGKRFWDSLRFSRETWKADLLWFIVFSIVAMPLVDAPRVPLAQAIFGDEMIATNLLFKPLPTWAFVLSFIFPLTIWFAELPTYFGYCIPRLAEQVNGWVAWLIASFFLAAQHTFLPLTCCGVSGCSCPLPSSSASPSNFARHYCPTL